MSIHDTHPYQMLMQAGIHLNISRKRVKNINFRLKPHTLSVSVPLWTSDKVLVDALQQRLDWVLSQHQKLLQQQTLTVQQQADNHLWLWGEVQDKHLDESEKLALYRQELSQVMPELFAKWQPIVGVTASETRIKTMRTRWGSCNTKARRIWLSTYLVAYPQMCTEYVIVHELCHLHHANHSPAFWAQVKQAMPEYKRWHDHLAGKLC
ncbi:M48 family metallopeptidase [Psychrobacter sp. I-STPA6b]|uniref:M48 family metallopeptidase n=1 Tax=Psychrobacter sp. I-STPA6b TaxID=2585718 RepID=UPI001D0CA428|nr:SprT family zinc-dependent metalloprotease [Psychrobacter sp. I-STPA6b]